MYPDEEEVQNAMQVFLKRSLGKLQGLDSSWLTTAGQLLQQNAPQWLTQRVERSVMLVVPVIWSYRKYLFSSTVCMPLHEALLILYWPLASCMANCKNANVCVSCRAFVANMWQQQQKHECSMTTVSNIVQDHSLSRIDLLKIDVERAELDVLLGISSTDWRVISQVVLEVHDVQGRLDRILQLLKDTAGFMSVTVTQDETLTGSTLYNIYCSRIRTGNQSAKVPHRKQTIHA